jgi:general secretion pathway protein J
LWKKIVADRRLQHRYRDLTGFTLVEVLIALGITVVVGLIAYSGLSSVLDSTEATTTHAERLHSVNRAFTVLSRDIRQVVARPVRDEFGEIRPALIGGELAEFPLSLTRGGWNNSIGSPRSELQRVRYYLEEDALWRETWLVLDRTSGSVSHRTKLLSDVEEFSVQFLDSRAEFDADSLSSNNWLDNWDIEQASESVVLPEAIAINLHVVAWGALRRIYELP